MQNANVVGHGIDIVDVEELRNLLNTGDHFTDRCFTVLELKAVGDGPNRVQRLAARFAAKEAVLKALGIGWGPGVAWTDVEIQTLPSGAPRVLLGGGAALASAALGIHTWLVSLSHTTGAAAASVIAIGTGDSSADPAPAAKM